MSIKTLVKKIIPSFRNRDIVLSEIRESNNRIQTLIKELDYKNEYLFYCSEHLEGEDLLETKQRVLRNFPTAYGTIRNVQIGSTYILKRVKEICDANGIQFTLAWGTLLGAVRHNGFIPWDDDIDIEMSIEDLYKLEELMKNDEELEIRRFYECADSSYKHSICSIKVTFKNNTAFWVDIFPISYIDLDANKEKCMSDILDLCRKHKDDLQRIMSENGFPFEEAYVCKPFKKIDEEVINLEKEYNKKLYEQYAKLNHKEAFCYAVNNPISWCKLVGINETNDTMPLKKEAVIFEDIPFDSFKNVEELLEKRFGDFWGLPRSVKQTHTKYNATLSPEDEAILLRLGLKHFN